MGKKISPSGASPRATAAEVWTVARVAADLGVPLEIVAELVEAQCSPGVDFTQVDGVAVVTTSGVEKIRALVSGRMSPTPPLAPLPTPARAAAIDNEDLRVTRVWRFSKNVTAERPNGQEVTVAVKRIDHLEVGMVLAGCVRGDNSWFYYGRLPRTIGERQLYFPPTKRRVTTR